MENDNEEWVEILLPYNNDEWPEPEIEDRFNWNLSMRDIDAKYKSKSASVAVYKYKAKSLVGQYLERKKIKEGKFLNPNALMYNKHAPISELTLEEFRDKMTKTPEPNFQCEEYHKWEVELFKNETWVKDNRYYEVEKKITDFDLHDISGVRRNANFVGIVQTQDF